MANGKRKKKKKTHQGIAAYKQLRAQDLGVKHGSTLDTVTNRFVGPHILLPAPALMTLACNHLFPLLLALRHRLAGTWATLNALWELEGSGQQMVPECGQKHL